MRVARCTYKGERRDPDVVDLSRLRAIEAPPPRSLPARVARGGVLPRVIVRADAVGALPAVAAEYRRLLNRASASGAEIIAAVAKVDEGAGVGHEVGRVRDVALGERLGEGGQQDEQAGEREDGSKDEQKGVLNPAGGGGWVLSHGQTPLQAG